MLLVGKALHANELKTVRSSPTESEAIRDTLLRLLNAGFLEVLDLLRTYPWSILVIFAVVSRPYVDFFQPIDLVLL